MELEYFDPVSYSPEENQFFLKHLGEPPIAVLQGKLPDGVNSTAVREVLGLVYDLEELKKHRGTDWAGRDRLIETIHLYLHEEQKWRDMAARGAPRFPSMHAWDGKGRPHRGGIGSDSNRVTTYIDNDGNRHPFRLKLRDPEVEAFAPPWTKEQEPVPDKAIEDWDRGRIECPVDGWTTSFKVESKQSYNMARARLARHCRSSKDERVREFALKVFS